MPSEIAFTPTPEQAAVRDRIRAFVDTEVIPEESALSTLEGVSWNTITRLRAQARAAGVYGPQLSQRHGGLGLDWRGVAIAFEEAGTSLIGPLALNCAAPDEGNMHLLEQVASPAQKARYLDPLAAGRIRSCFAMTEPAPGAGADPTMLQSRARRDGDAWVVDGHKWYITGADGAAFAIAMVRTSDDPDPRRGATMLLVDAGTPGFEIVRHIPSLDQTFPGGHCEVRFTNCRVPLDAVLGEPDLGFEYAQARLVPARLTHCMRWLGIARRALEIAAEHAVNRTGGGKALGEHQMVQAMLADSQIDLDAARLLIWRACAELDRGRPARGESSAAKVFVAEAVHRVVDRAIQICGALGISEDLPLSLFYREVRPFRVYDGPSEVHRAAVARRVLRAAQGRITARA
ncbi:MAG: acyl-CoA dehydrogenase family protein [Chloroflexi bacterium]|nr:acyl-CoA dehydrogenase family protein [Chloroflexota bacterium]